MDDDEDKEKDESMEDSDADDGELIDVPPIDYSDGDSANEDDEEISSDIAGDSNDMEEDDKDKGRTAGIKSKADEEGAGIWLALYVGVRTSTWMGGSMYMAVIGLGRELHATSDRESIAGHLFDMTQSTPTCCRTSEVFQPHIWLLT